MKKNLRGKIFHNAPSLQAAVLEEYGRVGRDTRFLQNLTASMLRRLDAVIEAAGGPTRY